jgi:Tol biopolymer transport system component
MLRAHRVLIALIGTMVLSLAATACIGSGPTSSGVETSPFTILFQRGDVPTMDFAYGNSDGDTRNVREVGFGFQDGAGASADGARLAFPTFVTDPSVPYLVLAFLDDAAAPDMVIPGGQAMAIAPSWAPDDSMVAFVRAVLDAPTGTGIFAMDASTGEPAAPLDLLPFEEFNYPDRCIAPTWSPDGTRLAYSTGTGVSVYSFDDHAVHALVPAGSATWTCAPRWSPDGSKIAYVAASGDGSARILVVASSGPGAATEVATVDGTPGGVPIRWSPDGTALAYTEADPAASGFAVRRVDAAGGAPMTLATVTNANSGTLGPALWSPAGDTLLFSCCEDSTLTEHLVTVPADGGKRTTLPLPLADSGYYRWLSGAR